MHNKKNQIIDGECFRDIMKCCQYTGTEPFAEDRISKAEYMEWKNKQKD